MFRDSLAKTAKFANLTVFRDDLAKTTKLKKLAVFRDELTRNGAADFTILTAIEKITNFTIFRRSSAIFTTCSPLL